MTKQDIIENVARKTGVSNTVVKAVIDETVETVARWVSEGIPIYIRGLFTLSPLKRAKKVGRNIQKGKRIIIPAHYTPHAKFAKDICEKVKKLPIK